MFRLTLDIAITTKTVSFWHIFQVFYLSFFTRYQLIPLLLLIFPMMAWGLHYIYSIVSKITPQEVVK